MIAMFGTRHKIARALGISRRAVVKWGEYVPDARRDSVYCLLTQIARQHSSTIPDKCFEGMQDEETEGGRVFFQAQKKMQVAPAVWREASNPAGGRRKQTFTGAVHKETGWFMKSSW